MFERFSFAAHGLELHAAGCDPLLSVFYLPPPTTTDDPDAAAQTVLDASFLTELEQQFFVMACDSPIRRRNCFVGDTNFEAEKKARRAGVDYFTDNQKQEVKI